MTVSIRPAREEDVGFLVALAGHPEVAPFLAQPELRFEKE